MIHVVKKQCVLMKYVLDMKYENLDELYLCMDKRNNNVDLVKQKCQNRHIVEYFDKICRDMIS